MSRPASPSLPYRDREGAVRRRAREDRSLTVAVRMGASLLLALGAVGCGKTVTADDCAKIADNMKLVWQTESARAASNDGADSEKAKNVIKSEGDKLVADWSVECKKELMGRRVDPKEVDCLLKAKTIDAVNKCAEP
jgi:hypothetical protein